MTERTYWRDLSYHLFHRAESIGRYLPPGSANTLAMQDVDSLEYCYYCHRPLALIEVKKGDARKCFTQPLVALARAADVPAYLVFYDIACRDNPAYVDRKNLDGRAVPDIDWFTVKPLPTGESRDYTPQGYAYWLAEIHLGCTCRRSQELLAHLRKTETSSKNQHTPANNSIS